MRTVRARGNAQNQTAGPSRDLIQAREKQICPVHQSTADIREKIKFTRYHQVVWAVLQIAFRPLKGLMGPRENKYIMQLCRCSEDEYRWIFTNLTYAEWVTICTLRHSVSGPLGNEPAMNGLPAPRQHGPGSPAYRPPVGGSRDAVPHLPMWRQQWEPSKQCHACGFAASLLKGQKVWAETNAFISWTIHS